jgi:Tfp pilus assembly protein PilW
METLVATGLFGIASLALCSIYLFSLRGFASLANYADLDKINRTAMDSLSQEIRQARYVSSATPNSISIINGDGVGVSYIFNTLNGKLIRTASDGSSKVLLSDCRLLAFSLYQRNPINGTYDIYPAATNNFSQSVKAISLTWKASRQILGGITTSENIQTARVIIRKQR